MSTRINVDNFTIGPRSRIWLWNLRRQHLGAFLINRLQWYYYPKYFKVPHFPLHVDFESSSLCNMGCPMCFRVRPDYDETQYGLLDFDLFKKGVAECGKYGLYSIRLNWRGEPTVHERLVDMIRLAKNKGIKEVSFISNGYTLEGKLAEEIVKAGVDYITISVDGLYEEYDRIRAPAKFADTVERLKNLRKLRDSIGNGYPRLRINSVWNESKGEDWFGRMYDFFSPIVDYMTFTPEYSHDGKAKQLKPNFTCQYPFQRITIMWDGTIPLCIADKKKSFSLGHLAKDNIYDLWHGEKINTARKIHLSHKASEIHCCSICDRAVTKQVGHKSGY